MIISTYHVFGSGSALMHDFVRPGMTAAEFVAALDAMHAVATDDGDNGFKGTYSVPDEMGDRLGVRCYAKFNPGGSLGKRDMEGLVEVLWTRHAVREAVKSGYGDLEVNEAGRLQCNAYAATVSSS